MLDIVIELIESGELTLSEALDEYELMSFERTELIDWYENR